MIVLAVGEGSLPLVVASGYILGRGVRGITLRTCEDVDAAVEVVSRGVLLVLVSASEVGELLGVAEVWGRVQGGSLLLMRRREEKWGGRRGRRFRSFVRQLRVEQEVSECHFFEDGGDGTS